MNEKEILALEDTRFDAMIAQLQGRHRGSFAPV
jgi:hypothetical protein